MVCLRLYGQNGTFLSANRCSSNVGCNLLPLWSDGEVKWWISNQFRLIFAQIKIVGLVGLDIFHFYSINVTINSFSPCYQNVSFFHFEFHFLKMFEKSLGILKANIIFVDSCNFSFYFMLNIIIEPIFQYTFARNLRIFLSTQNKKVY